MRGIGDVYHRVNTKRFLQSGLQNDAFQQRKRQHTIPFNPNFLKRFFFRCEQLRNFVRNKFRVRFGLPCREETRNDIGTRENNIRFTLLKLQNQNMHVPAALLREYFVQKRRLSRVQKAS
ncbi:hypothetical protein SDC9_110114 [bioreactor metagenome]|uniref:Uncharacterized protein n=1 Tax=bioreactor metagenome TaxID=1076179 RepID=A0A645BN64_9ZZZZ